MTEAEWLSCEDPDRMLRVLRKQDKRSGPGYNISDRQLRLFACGVCRQVWDFLQEDVLCPRCGGSSDGLTWTDPFAGEPKGQLIPCPVCKGTGRINRSRRAIEVGERFADAEATDAERGVALRDAELFLLPEGWDARDIATCAVRYLAELAALDVTWIAWRDADNERAMLVPPATQVEILRDIVGNPWQKVTLPRTKLITFSGSPAPGWPYQSPSTPEPPPVSIRVCPWLTTDVCHIAQTIYHDRTFDDMPILADALEDAGCTDSAVLEHCRQPGRHVRGCHVLDALLREDV